jgi:hypothetical protein
MICIHYEHVHGESALKICKTKGRIVLILRYVKSSLSIYVSVSSLEYPDCFVRAGALCEMVKV